MKGSVRTVKKPGRGSLRGDVEAILASPEKISVRLRRFASRLSSFLDGAAVSVYLHDRELGDLLLEGSSLRFRDGSGAARHSAAGTLSLAAIEERRILTLTERERPAESALRAEYHLLPLQGEEDVTGVVTVEHAAGRPLEGGRLVLVKEAVRLLAAEVDRVRHEEIASQRLTRISALSEAGVTLISAEKMEDLLQRVTATTLLVMGAEAIVVRLFDEDSGKYLLRDCHGLRSGEFRERLLQLEREAVLEVLKSGSPLLVRDVGRSKAYRSFRRAAASFICHPVENGGRVLGTLTVLNKASGNTFLPPCFTADDLENFGRLMRYVGKAVADALDRERRKALAERDEETGLPNERAFTSRLEAELSRARRFGTKVVLLSCLVDTSGTGAAAGGETREVLFRVAGTLRASLRDYDVVARIGESRFGAILPQTEDATRGAIPRVRGTLEKQFEALAGITLSQVVFPDDAEEADSLLQLLLGEGEQGARRSRPPSFPAETARVVEILAGRQIFFGLRDEQLASIAALAEELVYRAGETVFREGDSGEAFYLLEEGEVDIFRRGPDGVDVRLGSLKPGAVFGEMTLVIRELRSVTAVAARESRVLRLRHLDLTRLFYEDREILLLITMNMTRILAKRLRQSDVPFPEG